MILSTPSNPGTETSLELSSPEHHILQQLLLWKESVASVEEFRRKKAEALRQGWNGSGPIRESQVLSGIVRDLEEKLAQRLLAEKMGH